MSIEDNLESIASSLSIIAQVMVATADAPREVAALEKVVAKDTPADKEVKEIKKRRRSTKTASKPSASQDSTAESKSTSTPEKSEEEPEGPELKDVRTALSALQEAVDGQAARNVLSKVGGNGALSKVKKEKYQAVIDAANEATEKAQAADE